MIIRFNLFPLLVFSIDSLSRVVVVVVVAAVVDDDDVVVVVLVVRSDYGEITEMERRNDCDSVSESIRFWG
ncbi:hypothetical protein Scep_009185 [Stephania cephalantha]|uniref:NADH dehydrogenase subunit 4L n=1 Tax=Stephania cephalantha TaxID=152367 RepID=A0AAP0JTF2_9MAGN